MKTKYVIPFILLHAPLCFADGVDYLNHEVKEGDTISKLLGLKSLEVKLSKFRELNPQIADINLIVPGQIIKLPHLEKQKLYLIKNKDTLFEIANENWQTVETIKVLNTRIKNINFIRAQDYIYLPNKNLKREIARDNSSPIFISTYLLEEEIYYLYPEEAQFYINKFRTLVDEDKDRNEILRDALEFSQAIRADELSDIFQLLNSIEDKNLFKKELISFFSVWKKVRKSKTKEIN